MPDGLLLPRVFSPAWVGAWVALTLAVGLVLVERGIRRDVVLRVQFSNAGQCWEIGWEGPRGHNGHWLDAAEPQGAQRMSPAASGEPFEIRRRLPMDALREISLAWHDSPGGTLTVHESRVEFRVLGRVWGEEPLPLIRVEGGTLASASDGVLRVTAMPASGRVVWPGVGPPPGALLTVWIASALIAAGVILGLRALPALVAVAGLLPAAPRREAPRWLSFVTPLVVVGAQVYILLTSPMVMSADSTAYLWLAELAREHGNFDHLDGWRLPGFALLLLPLLGAGDYAGLLGVVHLVLGIACAGMIFAIVRSRAGSPWPHLAAMLAAVDPLAVLWQRHILSEHLGATLTIASCWAALVLCDTAHRGPLARRLALAGVLGVLLGLSCATRANLQVFAAFLPAAIVVCTAVHGRPARGLLAAALCVLLSGAVVAPIVLHNRTVFGRTALVVGLDWNRFLWLWDYGQVDWNQSGTLTFEQFRTLRSRCAAGINAWDVTDLLAEWRSREGRPGPHPWTDRDARCAEVWRESDARRPGAIWEITARSVAVHLGFYALEARHTPDDCGHLMGPLLGRAGPGAVNSSIFPLDRFPAGTRALLERGVKPLPPPGPAQRWLGRTYDASKVAHNFIGAAFLLGLLRTWNSRDRALLAIAAAMVLHAAVLPAWTFSWNPRYTMPLMGLVTALAIAGCRGRPPEPAPRDGARRT
ncbi:MAG: hypothetical protein DYG92_13560 [Leptolyngbya sp. PLA1]|nr:hypothetical protein [Leptolyngbya sp. PLA1]